jgi:magnesium/cobalt transport protein CorA
VRVVREGADDPVMPQNFLTCDREQVFWMPPDMREWLPEGHLAWFVLDAVGEMDLAAFYAAYRPDGHGRAAYEPVIMVALLLYAYTRAMRFFPPLARMDEQIDELEAAVLAGPTDEQLQRLFGLKRELVAMRRSSPPRRDLFARGIDQIADLPGLTLDERGYFRDVYDHLIRTSDLIDSYRDLLSGATDLYLSTVSNRQNEVMKQLAIVGTIFLPLSFITGWFGQNFTWLVQKGISSTWSFFVLGIGSIVATCVFLLAFFKRKGWV